MKERISRYRRKDFSEMRPLTSATGTRARAHSRKKRGQSSVSITSTAEGLTARSARRTLHFQSKGK
jgi:hypothetical protein